MQLLRDHWTLVAYYNMFPYWEGKTALDKTLTYLEKTCNKLEANDKCNMITPQLRHEYNELEYYNQLLLTQHFTEHSRQRRGLINGVGYLANSLFGVLDQRFAEQYARDIALIKQDQAHLKNLWTNQTSVVELEDNLVKRMEEITSKQHKLVNKHLISLDKAVNTLQDTLNIVNIEQDITLTAMSANSLLQKLKTIQKMVLDTLSDIYQGQFNLHLLTPQQLQNQLNIISGLLTSDITLPIENTYKDFYKIYKLLKIRARMTEDYFMFEIKIPLMSRDVYDLYHVISIPKPYGKQTISITPTSEFVGINLQKDSYLPLTQENLHQCVRRDSSTYLCDSQTPIFKINTAS
ncbi:baculovirus F protein domain-containing protein [Phthorimaea operculella]|nr:baculovirus F protein domain-containing protein [Phthorimaea operculella]